MTQDPAKDQADILSSQGIMLKSTMIDLHSMSERVSEILLTIPPPKELA
jgi:protein-arginine kinase